MKVNFLRRVLMSVGALVLLLIVASCSSKKSSLSYFQDITEQTSVVPLPSKELIKIAPSDELYILVTSAVAEASVQFNLPAVNPANKNEMLGYQSPRQLTYIVDSKGDIDFPQLGKMHVAGLTVEQLRDKLLTEISRYVEDPEVIVRMLNYRVNVLGEVVRPGAVQVNTERYTILDAIADTGDLTPYGDRTSVLLIREENGNQKRVILDLTSSELLTSDYFYMQPNDYVYVRPNRVREGNSKYDSNNSYKLSMISTVVSAASVIASLVIALTIK